jgi:hypothetical protein
VENSGFAILEAPRISQSCSVNDKGAYLLSDPGNAEQLLRLVEELRGHVVAPFGQIGPSMTVDIPHRQQLHFEVRAKQLGFLPAQVNGGDMGNIRFKVEQKP